MKRKKILLFSVSFLALFLFSFLIISSNIGEKESSPAKTKESKAEEIQEDAKPTPTKLESEKEKPKESNEKESENEKSDDVATDSDKETKNKNDKKESNEKSPKPSNEKSPKITKLPEVLTKYVNVSSLNVRSGPGTDHSSISVVINGDAVKVSETADGWSKISSGDKSGWVSSKYLTDVKPIVKKEEQPKANSDAKVAKTEGKKSSDPKPQQAISAPKNDADKLSTVGGNKQLILVTTDGYGTTSASIQTFEKDGNGKWNRMMNASGHVGKSGIGKGKEGDAKTPVGKYTIGTAFGQVGNPGTKMPWRDITSDDVWVDDSNSKYYNTWQSKSETQGSWNSAENMTHPLYKYGFAINYNTEQTPGKGSAIFFHTGSSYTLGCVSTPEANVVSILKWLDPAKSPVIIITSKGDLGKY